MQKVLIALLVLSIFLCVMNFPNYSVFDLDLFLDWLQGLDDSPPLFSDAFDDADTWLEQLAGGITDLFMILSYPIRFVIWFIPVVIDFVSSFVLYGVF